MYKIKILSLLALVLIIVAGCSVGDKKILTKETSQEDIDNATQQVEELEAFVSDIETETNESNTTTEGMDTQSQERTVVIMSTSMGDITIELFDDLSPNTVKNFTDLASSGFYDGILFHRIIPDFMIQAGDPLTKEQPKNWAIHGTGGPGYAFADEFNSEPIVRGSLAMANSGPNTNGSQFFIVVAEATPWLDGRHTNFGKVIDGMDIVDAIVSEPRDARDHPLEDITIESVSIQ